MNAKNSIYLAIVGAVFVASSMNVSAASHNGPIMMNGGNPGMMNQNMPNTMANRTGYDPGTCQNQGNMMPMNQYMMGNNTGMMNMMGQIPMGGMGSVYSRLNMISMLDLDPDQRNKLRTIQRDQRKQRWSIMGQIMDERDKLAELHGNSTRDPKAIGNAYEVIFKLKKQLIEANVISGNKAMALLNDDQRKALHSIEDQVNMGNMGNMGRMMY